MLRTNHASLKTPGLGHLLSFRHFFQLHVCNTPLHVRRLLPASLLKDLDAHFLYVRSSSALSDTGIPIDDTSFPGTQPQLLLQLRSRTHLVGPSWEAMQPHEE